VHFASAVADGPLHRINGLRDEAANSCGISAYAIELFDIFFDGDFVISV